MTKPLPITIFDLFFKISNLSVMIFKTQNLISYRAMSRILTSKNGTKCQLFQII